jgi:hypothetical protein
VVSPPPILAAGVEGRNRGIKEWKFQDEREWGKKCFDDLDQRRMGRPVMRTWSTDFLLLREGSSREEIGKWLKNKSIPWQRRRRLLQVVTGTFPCGQQMCPGPRPLLETPFMARDHQAHIRQRCLRPSAVDDVCLHDARFGNPHTLLSPPAQ